MNIVYSTDDKFASKVGVSICSLFENNRDAESIHVYILGQDISKINAERLIGLATKPGQTVEIIPICEMKQYLDLDANTWHWSSLVLARIVMDRLLPAEVNRVIFLDGDTIVRSSLATLWEYDMQGAVVGACLSIKRNEKMRAFMQLRKQDAFICGGVLLYDLKQWRETGISEQIIQYIQTNAEHLYTLDEDGIVGACHGRICYLPPKYNWCNMYYELYTYSGQKKVVGGERYYTKEVFSESAAHPAIIHYLGDDRPWREGCRHRFKKEYLQYLSMTPWKDEAPEKGWKTYIAMWHLFNCVMRPFPRLRYVIIGRLAPAYSRWKKNKQRKQ